MRYKLIDHSILLRLFVGEILNYEAIQTYTTINSIAIACVVIRTSLYRSTSAKARVNDIILSFLQEIVNQGIMIIPKQSDVIDANYFAITKNEAYSKKRKMLSDNFIWTIAICQAWKYELISSYGNENKYSGFPSLEVEYI